MDAAGKKDGGAGGATSVFLLKEVSKRALDFRLRLKPKLGSEHRGKNMFHDFHVNISMQ